VAIARALYKDAPFVILDEPTAALDPIAEAGIYENFDSLVGEKTAVYISHRMSSCKFCDRIVVLDHGEIAEEGTHEQLLEQNGIYAKLYQTQAEYYVTAQAGA
jgi:ATP-binding cassette subfamily B protein